MLLLLGLAAAGCGGSDQQGSPASQMSAWVSGTSFGTTVNALDADTRHATTVMATGSEAAIHTVCGVLLLDVEQANGNLPTPDQQSTDLLATAYNNLGAAAHQCYDSPGSPAKQAAFIVSRARGLSALSESVARIEEVLGKPLSKVGGATYGSDPSASSGI